MERVNMARARQMNKTHTVKKLGPAQNAFIASGVIAFSILFYAIAMVLGVTTVVPNTFDEIAAAAPLDFFPTRIYWIIYMSLIMIFGVFFLVMIIKRWQTDDAKFAKELPVPAIIFSGALALSAIAIICDLFDVTIWFVFACQMIAFLAYFFVVVPTRFMSNPIEGLWDDNGDRRKNDPVEAKNPAYEMTESYPANPFHKSGTIRSSMHKLLPTNRQLEDSKVISEDFRAGEFTSRWKRWAAWFTIHDKYNGWPLDRRALVVGMVFAWEAVAFASTICRCVYVATSDLDTTLLATSIAFPIISAFTIFFCFFSWSWGGLIAGILAPLFFVVSSTQLLWWGIGAAGISLVAFVGMAYTEITNIDYQDFW